MPPADSLCLWPKRRWRSILREEEFGVIKTLKRLDHTNPSVVIDGMNGYQANNNKRWQKSIIPERSCFHFCGEQTPTTFMACCSNDKSWWDAEFWVDDRLRPCKHISLELPSPIFIVGLSNRVGERSNCDSTCFSGCEFFFATRLYNRNDSHLDMSDLRSWLSG